MSSNCVWEQSVLLSYIEPGKQIKTDTWAYVLDADAMWMEGRFIGLWAWFSHKQWNGMKKWRRAESSLYSEGFVILPATEGQSCPD